MMMVDNGGYDGGALRKCVMFDGGEICATFYFGDWTVTLDHTVAVNKFMRIDMEQLEPDEEHIDDVESIVVEFEESESDDEEDGEFGFEDEEYENVRIEHEDYEIMRNEKIFGFKSDDEIVNEYENEGMTDYINTILWVWRKHECNEDMLSFMNMSICTIGGMDHNMDKDIVIYNKYNGERDVDIEGDDMFDFNEIQFNVRNEMDWDEIYDINMFNKENKKLCKIESVIKICVEIVSDEYVNGNI
eukprot:UN13175